MFSSRSGYGEGRVTGRSGLGFTFLSWDFFGKSGKEGDDCDSAGIFVANRGNEGFFCLEGSIVRQCK